MAGRPVRRAAQTLVVPVVAVVMAGAFVVLAAPAWSYLTGSPATATVEHCRHEIHGKRGRASTRCTGSWRMGDGTRGAGEIDGVGSADVGATVAARGDQRAVAVARPRLFLPPGVMLGLIGLFAAGYFWTGPFRPPRTPVRGSRDVR